MKVSLPDGTVRTGRGIDLSVFDVTTDSILSAIREPGPTEDGLRIECPEPGPSHDRLARVPLSNPTRGHVLAAVGRSRGMETGVDDELGRLEARLAEHTASDDASTVQQRRTARRRVADAGDDETRLRERAATLRGRLNAHREAGDDEAIAATRSELVDVTTKLSEVETERIAAEQRLDALERGARRTRDSRDERLRLSDAIANRRRDARAYFVDVLGDEFDAVVRDLEPDCSGRTPVDPVVVSLAAITMADLDAPVVSTCRFFPDVKTAARRLGTPVIWV
ncbi:hypothetical protein GJR96_04135 [Haloferax sp. MBLA0076]|uniref:Uncharacterized protein n=1 Tax=Haloferax litoreum TaxID=2666140 RepID=A0A6A8GE88_9EURY|nr:MULTISPECIES: hypothetical protein [Haloferax]KAB1192670.1 hypothetical protein Hfx1148_04125 [Haloferax sp. CBA1148]MRX21146.1 hypothetical protein [Haloferax litoreum]